MSVFIGYPSFMAYQMMKGKKDNNDGFPSIPGMIARYSALGLTNEQMKENPVWVDKTGNGHDLQMKNFAWSGMSGVGVYVVLKGNKTLIPSNVVRAVTSEGKVYDENWNEYNIVPGNISSNYTMVNLGFDGSNQFAESATKLAGIYSSALSKDDCIKAYNYLQTLKAK